MSEYEEIPKEAIISFRDRRNWAQFHNPKDLAISLSLEAAELLECFQWSADDLAVKAKKAEMEKELADIFIYATLFADAIDSNIKEIIEKKLLENEKKYGVKKSWGSAKKYTELNED